MRPPDITGCARRDSTTEQAKERLQEIARYERNWAGYDADPPSPYVIDLAGRVLEQLPKAPVVSAHPSGTVQFEFDGPDGYLELTFRDDPSVECIWKTPDGEWKGGGMSDEDAVKRVLEFFQARGTND